MWDATASVDRVWTRAEGGADEWHPTVAHYCHLDTIIRAGGNVSLVLERCVSVTGYRIGNGGESHVAIIYLDREIR